MTYGDEKIAALLNQHKKSIHGDLETGLYVKEELFHFRRVFLYSDRFSMMFPLRLQPADEDYLEAVYKDERPDVVLCHRRRNISLQITRLKVQEDISASDFLDLSQKSIEKLKTGIVIYQKDKIKVNDAEIAWLDYKSVTPDSNLYNMYALIDIEGVKYQLSFFCIIHEGPYWREVLKRMFSSIEVND